jgi:hypothetical protein
MKGTTESRFRSNRSKYLSLLIKLTRQKAKNSNCWSLNQLISMLIHLLLRKNLGEMVVSTPTPLKTDQRKLYTIPPLLLTRVSINLHLNLSPLNVKLMNKNTSMRISKSNWMCVCQSVTNLTGRWRCSKGRTRNLRKQKSF